MRQQSSTPEILGRFEAAMAARRHHRRPRFPRMKPWEDRSERCFRVKLTSGPAEQLFRPPAAGVRPLRAAAGRIPGLRIRRPSRFWANTLQRAESPQPVSLAGPTASKPCGCTWNTPASRTWAGGVGLVLPRPVKECVIGPGPAGGAAVLPLRRHYPTEVDGVQPAPPGGPRRFCANFSTRWPLWGVGDPHPEFSLYTYHIHLRGTFQHDKHY